MDYQEYVLTLLRKEVDKFKFESVIDMKSETHGRLLVMKSHQIAGCLWFDFGEAVTISIGYPQPIIGIGRNNRIFTWKFDDFDDVNEEVQRLFKIWHLVLKEVAETEKAA
jgi:hypothetical protein